MRKPKTPWRGIRGNWIAPFHACPICGASLNWTQIDDALERPWIKAVCPCRAADEIPGSIFWIPLKEATANG